MKCLRTEQHHTLVSLKGSLNMKRIFRCYDPKTRLYIFCEGIVSTEYLKRFVHYEGNFVSVPKQFEETHHHASKTMTSISWLVNPTPQGHVTPPYDQGL